MLTKLILGGLAGAFVLREFWTLLRHGARKTTAAAMLRISKQWPILPLAAGIVIGYGLSRGGGPQRFVRLFEAVAEHVRPSTGALASSASSASSALLEAAGAEVPVQAPVEAPFQVIKSHPRFWGTDAEVAELVAKAATREGKTIIKDALARTKGKPDNTGDRMLCGAFFYRFGEQLGTDAATRQTLGAQAVEDLMGAIPRQGIQADVGWSGAPWAIAYDWLFPLLTADQKTKLLETATKTLEDRNDADGSTWRGLNQLSGDIPMALALATYGETAKEYVGDVYQNNWFASRPRYYNYAWQKIAWADGGSREGLGYFSNDCYTNFAMRALWESATGGDKSLAMGYFDNTPLWALHQVVPDGWKVGSFPPCLSTTTFAGGANFTRMLCWNLESCTSFSPPDMQQLARWILSQIGSWPSIRTVGDELLFGLLIGDPRVKATDPAKLGLPLIFTMAQPGQIFIRSDWTPQANVAWFGNHTTGSRITPAGEFMLYSKGAYLFGNAAIRIAHSYGCRWFLCGVCFVGAQGTPVFSNTNVGSIPDYRQRGTFSVSTDPDSSAVTVSAQCAKNFTEMKGGPPTSLIQHCDRTFTCDAGVTKITLVDDIACDKSLTPHVVFPCPTEPVVSMENGQLSVAIKNGAASCTMTFATDNGQPTADQILAIGGPKNFADGLPGTAHAGKPFLLASTEVDKDFTKLATANPAAAIKQMGFWRLHVVLPAGGGKLTTTISLR